MLQQKNESIKNWYHQTGAMRILDLRRQHKYKKVDHYLQDAHQLMDQYGITSDLHIPCTAHDIEKFLQKELQDEYEPVMLRIKGKGKTKIDLASLVVEEPVEPAPIYYIEQKIQQSKSEKKPEKEKETVIDVDAKVIEDNPVVIHVQDDGTPIVEKSEKPTKPHNPVNDYDPEKDQKNKIIQEIARQAQKYTLKGSKVNVTKTTPPNSSEYDMVIMTPSGRTITYQVDYGSILPNRVSIISLSNGRVVPVPIIKKYKALLTNMMNEPYNIPQEIYDEIYREFVVDDHQRTMIIYNYIDFTKQNIIYSLSPEDRLTLFQNLIIVAQAYQQQIRFRFEKFSNVSSFVLVSDNKVKFTSPMPLSIGNIRVTFNNGQMSAENLSQVSENRQAA